MQNATFLPTGPIAAQHTENNASHTEIVEQEPTNPLNNTLALNTVSFENLDCQNWLMPHMILTSLINFAITNKTYLFQVQAFCRSQLLPEFRNQPATIYLYAHKPDSRMDKFVPDCQAGRKGLISQGLGPDTIRQIANGDIKIEQAKQQRMAKLEDIKKDLSNAQIDADMKRALFKNIDEPAHLVKYAIDGLMTFEQMLGLTVRQIDFMNNPSNQKYIDNEQISMQEVFMLFQYDIEGLHFTHAPKDFLKNPSDEKYIGKYKDNDRISMAEILTLCRSDVKNPITPMGEEETYEQTLQHPLFNSFLQDIQNQRFSTASAKIGLLQELGDRETKDIILDIVFKQTKEIQFELGFVCQENGIESYADELFLMAAENGHPLAYSYINPMLAEV